MRGALPGMLGLGAAVVSACGAQPAEADSSTSTSGTTVGPTTSSGWTSPGDFSLTVSWSDDGGDPADLSCGDAVDIYIMDPLGVVDWNLGFADSRAGGWTGEDCLNGYGGYALCHPVGTTHTLYEVEDCLASSVVPGESTLLDASKDPFLTYYLADATWCVTWGADVAYYATLGCTEMM